MLRVGAGGDGEARWKDGGDEVGGRELAAAEARIPEENFRQTEWVREGVLSNILCRRAGEEEEKLEVQERVREERVLVVSAEERTLYRHEYTGNN